MDLNTSFRSTKRNVSGFLLVEVSGSRLTEGKSSMRNLFKPRNQGPNPSRYRHNDLRPEKKFHNVYTHVHNGNRIIYNTKRVCDSVTHFQPIICIIFFQE
ncbi:hypothetical protein LXL04_005230 [Taraxacum kok-saghyz]